MTTAGGTSNQMTYLREKDKGGGIIWVGGLGWLSVVGAGVLRADGDAVLIEGSMAVIGAARATDGRHRPATRDRNRIRALCLTRLTRSCRNTAPFRRPMRFARAP